MKLSILTEKLARRGHHLTREYSVDLAALAGMQDIMTPNAERLAIDADRQPIGLVSRVEILDWIGGVVPRSIPLRDALNDRVLVVTLPDETVSPVAIRMLSKNAPRIPVVGAGTQRLLEIISKADIMNLRWREFEAETMRESHFLRRKNGWVSELESATGTDTAA